jgi:hypothetical protein
MIQKYVMLNGSGSATNASATLALIAGQAGKVIRVTGGSIAVTTAAVGGSGKVSLKDGTTVIMSWDANSVANISFNFGETTGYPLTAGNTLNVVTEGAVTTQATIFAAMVGFLAA